MPIKRTAEELDRPPLPRGSACHRCFTRKVRCSGQPEPGSGVYGCTSCLRTARHRNHDVSQVRCSFEREGLCSEEGGPTLSGEILPGSTPTGPTRRQRPSARSNYSSSTNSSRSVVSTSSSARTDSYSTDASSVAPRSSSTSAKNSPRPTLDGFPTRLPSPPASFQFPAPQFPSQPRYPSSLPPLIVPTAVPLSTEAVASLPDGTEEELELPTPTANATKSMQTLLHRRVNAPARQLSLSRVPTSADGSPYSINSPYVGGEYRQQTSAPLMLPPSWPNNHNQRNNNDNRGGGGGGASDSSQEQFAEYPAAQLPLPQYVLDGPLPNTSFALDLAPFSALTPSTLARMNLTPTSSYDFSSTSQQPSGITQPASFSPIGVAFTGSSHSLATPASSQPGDPSFSSALSGYASSTSQSFTLPQSHSQHSHTSQPQPQAHSELPPHPNFAYPSTYPLPLGPPSHFYPHYQQQHQSDGQNHTSGGEEIPTTGYASSFHLPSPGITFSSSIPRPDFRQEQQEAPRYYFERPDG
ncbi:uncharacterized protein JCM6883_003970 [Sporobolomyces salmoneus]|uniref:uncharacterized protein n=1 Tax=Sporobolomyces salmoneus TaxID=183962 RepID=UPI00317EFBA0